MSDVAILCEGLSKLYRIGKRERYKTLSGTLTDTMYAPFRRLQSLWNNSSNGDSQEDATIWALRDVSFEVKQGEVVGVIGRNGAGKSTLLKIFSRITEPTEGRVEVRGRVASLLEVGTGFHPELTGRENIYLNGAILGMTKGEIDRKFDEIVDFSEVERFIDTPMKHYSSGMYVRLAFAVAAHLEPEILLVDEVLAVGDIAFQQKCLGHMGKIAETGRTVLFVSHNMIVVGRLCRTAILLDDGSLAMLAPALEVTQHYQQKAMAQCRSSKPGTIYVRPENAEESDCEISEVEVRDLHGQPLTSLHTWQDVRFRIHYVSRRPIRRASFVLDLSTFQGTRLIRLSSAPLSTVYVDIPAGSGFVDCVIYRIPFSGGSYLLGAGIALAMSGEWLWYQEHLGRFDVLATDVYESGRAPENRVSLLAVAHKWETSRAQ